MNGTCVVGGCFEPENWNLQVDEETKKRIIENVRMIYPEFENNTTYVKDVVGLRPVRNNGVRVELEMIGSSAIPLVHKYEQ